MRRLTTGQELAATSGSVLSKHTRRMASGLSVKNLVAGARFWVQKKTPTTITWRGSNSVSLAELAHESARSKRAGTAGGSHPACVVWACLTL